MFRLDRPFLRVERNRISVRHNANRIHTIFIILAASYWLRHISLYSLIYRVFEPVRKKKLNLLSIMSSKKVVASQPGHRLGGLGHPDFPGRPKDSSARRQRATPIPPQKNEITQFNKVRPRSALELEPLAASGTLIESFLHC